jgi:hypothetical protein
MQSANTRCHPNGKERGQSEADAWFTPRRFSFLFAALVILVFPKILLGRETFCYQDFADFGYPLAYYFRESFWHGKVPLWNPYNDCGLPFMAQWNTQTLYPGSLFYLIFPLPWSLCVFCLSHLFWAALGMYFLARHRTGNCFAATVAGSAYGFNGLIWFSTMWPNYVASLSWVPWAVLAAELAWVRGGRLILLAGFVCAMQFLSGTPEVVALTWVAIGGFWLVHLARRTASRKRLFKRLFSVFAITLCLSAVQLLPFLELLACSQRNASFGEGTWSMPLTGWANYLIPLFHVEHSPLGIWFQHGQFYFPSYYVGIGIIALAALASWKVHRSEVFCLVALTATAVIFAMGDKGLLYLWFHRLFPLIGFMRHPVKFVILSTFAIPLLSAYGLTWVTSSPAVKWREERTLCILTLGFIFSILLGSITLHAVAFQELSDDIWLTLENIIGRAVALVGVLICLLMLLKTTTLCKLLVLRFALLTILALDVITHAPLLAPGISSRYYHASLPKEALNWIANLQSKKSRAFVTDASSLAIERAYPNTAEDSFTRRRLAVFDDLNLPDHVVKIDGFFALYLHDMNVIEMELNERTDADRLPLLNFLSVSQISGSHNKAWLSNDAFMPVITAGQEPVFANQTNALRGIISLKFDPRRFVYLPLEAKPNIVAHFNTAKVLSSTISAGTVEAEIEADVPTMVVVAQTFYHPWHAYIDGKAAVLWRANYAFQSVELPAGRHRVRLIYEDRAFFRGALISLMTVAGSIIAWKRIGFKDSTKRNQR